MPYDYNSTSSLAHARNFKYIKREPDGKGGWRYYYDVKKHGADIKKRVEDKTGITARNRMNDAYKKYENANAKSEKAYSEARDAERKKMDAKYRKGAALDRYLYEKDRRSGEAYRDAAIEAKKASDKFDIAYQKFKPLQEATNKAGSDYNTHKVTYERIPLVKLSKEVKAGADKIKTWFESIPDKVDDISNKAKDKVNEINDKTKDKLGYDERERLEDAERELESIHKWRDYNLSSYADVLQTEERQLADIKKFQKEWESQGFSANKEYTKRKEREIEEWKEDMKTATKEWDDQLTEANAVVEARRNEYLNTPVGKIDTINKKGRDFMDKLFTEERKVTNVSVTTELKPIREINTNPVFKKKKK